MSELLPAFIVSFFTQAGGRHDGRSWQYSYLVLQLVLIWESFWFIQTIFQILGQMGLYLGVSSKGFFPYITTFSLIPSLPTELRYFYTQSLLHRPLYTQGLPHHPLFLDLHFTNTNVHQSMGKLLCYILRQTISTLTELFGMRFSRCVVMHK